MNNEKRTDEYMPTEAESLLLDVLHQLSTDSDLENVTAPEKYKSLVHGIREYLSQRDLFP